MMLGKGIIRLLLPHRRVALGAVGEQRRFLGTDSVHCDTGVSVPESPPLWGAGGVLGSLAPPRLFLLGALRWPEMVIYKVSIFGCLS